MVTKKTDNVLLASKVALRRWLLERMEFSEVTVLDTCAGAGHVWRAMEDHVTIRQWTRCDLKPRQAGTLAIAATQAIRSLPVDAYNVIDIDPYGEPWEPYREALARLTRPTAMFLTHGHVMQSQVSSANLEAVGLPADWPVPKTPALSAFVAELSLREAWRWATVEWSARITFPRVTYHALGLIPIEKAQVRNG